MLAGGGRAAILTTGNKYRALAVVGLLLLGCPWCLVVALVVLADGRGRWDWRVVVECSKELLSLNSHSKTAKKKRRCMEERVGRSPFLCYFEGFPNEQN